MAFKITRRDIDNILASIININEDILGDGAFDYIETVIPSLYHNEFYKGIYKKSDIKFKILDDFPRCAKTSDYNYIDYSNFSNRNYWYKFRVYYKLIKEYDEIIDKRYITERGFVGMKFKDADGQVCSIQESSSIEPCIWLGYDKITPKLSLSDIDKEKQGYIDYPIPDCVFIPGKMNLNQQQVKKLLPYLEYFAEHGNLKNFYE